MFTDIVSWTTRLSVTFYWPIFERQQIGSYCSSVLRNLLALNLGYSCLMAGSSTTLGNSPLQPFSLLDMFHPPCILVSSVFYTQYLCPDIYNLWSLHGWPHTVLNCFNWIFLFHEKSIALFLINLPLTNARSEAIYVYVSGISVSEIFCDWLEVFGGLSELGCWFENAGPTAAELETDKSIPPCVKVKQAWIHASAHFHSLVLH
jgi:hypothetical protein